MTTTQPRPVPLLDDVATSSGLSSPSENDAGFGALETLRGRLPLTALDVTGRIDGLLSQVTVRQTFMNATDEPLEATYIFPLPDRAAVTDFRMEVAGRVVEGVLKERGQARREYAQAVRQGHRASIAEEDRPGVFSLRVGNLVPGDVATVQLTFAGVLPYRDGEVTFRFPLVVAPRYIPGIPLSGPSVGSGTAVDTTAVPDASRISPPVLLAGFPNPVRLSLAIDVYEPADDLRVSLFTVSGEKQGDFRRLTLQPGERLDRDFILRFRLGGDLVRTSLSLHPDAATSEEGTFALTIVPPAKTAGAAVIERPRDVVFLLDRSGSMSGWKMVAARRALARMIDTLVDADRFAVFAFDDRIETPRPAERPLGLIAATDRHRFQAVEFLARLESRGGTEIVEPLGKAVEILGHPGGDRHHILVLVTDGQVGNEDQVLKMLGERLRGIRVFTLGIDQAVNEGFLRRLAELGQGGGSCELVESEDRLDRVMDTIHARIGTPVVTEVGLVPAASGLELLTDMVVPDRRLSLFAGSPALLLGRYRGQPRGPLELRGTTPSATAWRESVVPCVRDNPAIAAAWARGRVRQLEDRYAAGVGDHSELEKTLIATSLRFGVLCRFTSYVAVDRAAVVNEGGEVHQITQPVEMPAGWGEVADVATPCCAAPADTKTLAVTRARSSPKMASRLMEQQANFGVSAKVRSAPSMPSAPSVPFAPSMSFSLSDTLMGAEPPPPAGTGEPSRGAGFDQIELIGEDDHGKLFKARDWRKRLLTIRTLTKLVTLDSAAAVTRLEKELKRLKHAAIAPIKKLIVDARPELVIGVATAYVPASTLDPWLSPVGLFDPQAAARLVLALAEALEYAARRHMIHGNLTPRQILMGDDGQPRITGFELARLGRGPDVSHATVRVYVAPERLQSPGTPPTAQTDVFSLGVIFYQLLTGQLPDRARPRPPRAIRPEVPAELEAICLKAIAAEPAARYSSSGELADDVRGALGIKKKQGLLGMIRDAGRRP